MFCIFYFKQIFALHLFILDTCIWINLSMKKTVGDVANFPLKTLKMLLISSFLHFRFGYSFLKHL